MKTGFSRNNAPFPKPNGPISAKTPKYSLARVLGVFALFSLCIHEQRTPSGGHIIIIFFRKLNTRIAISAGSFRSSSISSSSCRIVREAHRTGGYVIMAHPHLVSEPISYQGNKIHLSVYIEKLIEAGLDGIEASYTYDKTSYSGKLTKDEIIADIQEYYGDRLFISGGSDYHADGKKGVKNPREIGDCEITLEEFLANDRLVAMLPHRPE